MTLNYRNINCTGVRTSTGLCSHNPGVYKLPDIEFWSFGTWRLAGLAQIYQRSEGTRWHSLTQAFVFIKFCNCACDLPFSFANIPRFTAVHCVLEYSKEERSLWVESGDRGGISIATVRPVELRGKYSSDMALRLVGIRAHTNTHTHTDKMVMP